MEAVKRIVFLLFLGGAGALIFRATCFESIYLASDSMAPTVVTGERAIVNKLAFRFRAPKRGDIVMFHTPQGPDKDLVKRIIAVAGDIIEIRKKEVFLNGQKLIEPYVRHVDKDTILTGDNLPSILIPEGHVFVMGDNRDQSRDSRDWESSTGEWSPYVPLTAIKGLVIPNKG